MLLVVRWVALVVWLVALAWWIVGVVRWRLARGPDERLEALGPILAAAVLLCVSGGALELAVHL